MAEADHRPCWTEHFTFRDDGDNETADEPHCASFGDECSGAWPCEVELARRAILHVHEFVRTWSGGRVIDIRCGCGMTPIDMLRDMPVRPDS